LTVSLTDKTRWAAQAAQKAPSVVLEIEGVSTFYGNVIIEKYALIGDEITIGDPETNPDSVYIGGLNEIADQDDAVSIDDTTTSIRQMLQIDLGQGGSISTMSVALLDGQGKITRLITPGQIIDDILQARCKVHLGFTGTAFPDDYVTIFRGVVTDVVGDAGKIVITINHPDDRKKGSIFKKAQTTTPLAVTASQTVIPVDSLDNILVGVTGPDGATVDDSFDGALKVEDELIKYTALLDTQSFTATLSIASPCVATATGHPLSNGVPVLLSTTGVLPTGLLANTVYYVINKAANTFQLSATPGGSAINTSGSQAGTHTVTNYRSVMNCTRGYLDTTAASHDANADIETFGRLLGNPVELALKLMASTGDGSKYLSNLACTSFVDVDGDAVANSVFFKLVNIIEKYNVQIGDYVTITGASNGANNVTAKQIDDIVETETGTYLVLSGVTLVSELATSAVISFRSQWDTLPDGLALINDEIDIDEHMRLRDLFLSDIQFDIYLKDTIDDTRKFIEQELYSPIAAFSIPRKSRCSMGYHVGPIPGRTLKTFDASNIKKPSGVKLTRSTNRQFYNEIVYRYDEQPTEDKYLSGIITISEDSKAQIHGYNKTLTITSKGLRSTENGAHIALLQSNARLKRYQYAAEVLSFGTLFGDGFDVEIGDIIWCDLTGLGISDIKTATKGMAGRYFFVQNKTLNFKTGDVMLECIDTHFDATGRYGLMSPSSIVASGDDSEHFTIASSYSAKFGGAEHKKWADLIGATIRLRTADFVTLGECTLLEARSNDIVVSALAFTPSAGMVMELVEYNDQELESAQNTYVAMKNAAFDDGKEQFILI
jgi:hypothetical protein